MDEPALLGVISTCVHRDRRAHGCRPSHRAAVAASDCHPRPDWEDCVGPACLLKRRRPSDCQRPRRHLRMATVRSLDPTLCTRPAGRPAGRPVPTPRLLSCVPRPPDRLPVTPVRGTARLCFMAGLGPLIDGLGFSVAHRPAPRASRPHHRQRVRPRNRRNSDWQNGCQANHYVA